MNCCHAQFWAHLHMAQLICVGLSLTVWGYKPWLSRAFQLWLPLRKKGQTWACVPRLLHETLQLRICEASRICTQDLHTFLQCCQLFVSCTSSLFWIRKYMPNYTPSCTIRKQLIIMVTASTPQNVKMVHSWNFMIIVSFLTDCIFQPIAENTVHTCEC